MSETPKEMTTTHMPPDDIDKLRFKAFATNNKDNVLAYYKAASLYFQERQERAINRQAALDALLKAERVKALREAAEAPAPMFGLLSPMRTNDEHFFQKGFEAYRAALIEKETGQ